MSYKKRTLDCELPKNVVKLVLLLQSNQMCIYQLQTFHLIYIDNRPVFVAGDFNAHISSPRCR